MRCPYCGSDAVNAPTIDIGVGEIPCGPAGCEDCRSFQLSPDQEPQTDKEKETGWRRGSDE